MNFKHVREVNDITDRSFSIANCTSPYRGLSTCNDRCCPRHKPATYAMFAAKHRKER